MGTLVWYLYAYGFQMQVMQGSCCYNNTNKGQGQGVKIFRLCVVFVSSGTDEEEDDDE